MASLKNLEAALLQLQGKALEHYGAIEIMINNPTGISEHTDYVGEIIKHAKGLSECEEAYGTLQNHFVPKPQPQSPVVASVEPPVEPQPAKAKESITVDSENSPTMKRALKRTTSRKKREAEKDDQ